jgi:hypothetical protein
MKSRKLWMPPPFSYKITASPCDSGAGSDSFILARLGDSSLHHWSRTHR